MSSSRPFFETASGDLDRAQLLSEALPLAKFIAPVGLIALVPILIQILLIERVGLLPILAGAFTVLTQAVLAVGTGLVFMYVIVRANQLAIK